MTQAQPKETKQIQPKQRIPWIDTAKGIAMILVILGHTIEEPVLRGTIYSFHMPLFFILSGMTYTYATTGKKFLANGKKSLKRLLVPALLISLVYKTLQILTVPIVFLSWQEFWQYIIEQAKSIFWASCVDIPTENGVIFAIGLPWFLFALFFGRCLVDILQIRYPDKIVAPFLVLLTSALIMSGVWLPLSLDLAGIIALFIYIGKCLKEADLTAHPVRNAGISFVLWAATLSIAPLEGILEGRQYFELAYRRFPQYPLCFITAVSGAVFFLYVCMLLVKCKPIAAVFCYIGRYSMVIYLIHTLDGLWLQDLLALTEDRWIVSAVRTGIVLVLFMLYQMYRIGLEKAQNVCFPVKAMKQMVEDEF